MRPPVRTPLLIALLAALGAPACEAADECNNGDDYCADGVAHICGSSQSGSGSVRVWRTKACASAMCALANGQATCVLADVKDARCVSEGSYCVDDTHAVGCIDGYVIAHQTCATCVDGTCSGYLDDDCPTSGCADGLFCADHDGRCALTCDCPEGTSCGTCDAVSERAETDWLCVGQRCVRGQE